MHAVNYNHVLISILALSKFVNLRRVRGISRRDIPWGSQKNRGCQVEQKALMQFVFPGA